MFSDHAIVVCSYLVLGEISQHAVMNIADGNARFLADWLRRAEAPVRLGRALCYNRSRQMLTHRRAQFNLYAASLNIQVDLFAAFSLSGVLRMAWDV